ncbi:MAG: hypothetical protein KDA84_04015 [Planctomycetaceae bacterium]|nr:hypothetical protein [Planctomycetaceae bacterium]
MEPIPTPPENDLLPMRAELEQRFQSTVIVFEKNGQLHPGGACRCCGCGPNARPDYQHEPRYIYKANLCDADGVFYAMACEDCLEEIRLANRLRPKTDRDEMAEIIGEMMDEDLDGSQSMMDDFMDFEFE